MRELKQQSVRTGIWTNITDEDIAKASDEVEQPPEQGMGGMPSLPGMGSEEEPEQPKESGGEDDKNFHQAEGTPQKVNDAWKTLGNGVHVNLSKGGRVTKGPKELQGKNMAEVSSKKNLQSSKSNGNVYSIIEDKLRNERVDGNPLLHLGEKVMKPEPIKLKSMNPHTFKHNMSLIEAQKFVDEALIMLKQSKDKNVYIAKDGTAIVISPNGRVITAYSLKEYDAEQLRKLEVIVDVLQNNK